MKLRASLIIIASSLALDARPREAHAALLDQCLEIDKTCNGQANPICTKNEECAGGSRHEAACGYAQRWTRSGGACSTSPVRESAALAVTALVSILLGVAMSRRVPRRRGA